MSYRTKLNVIYLFCFFIICNKSIGQSRFDSIIKHSKRSSTHKLKLEFSDSLGNKTFLPILIVKGKQKGKTFTILAGVHGAEYAPIIATQELIKELKPGLNALFGTPKKKRSRTKKGRYKADNPKTKDINEAYK